MPPKSEFVRMKRSGIVIIGRNEGSRLKRCLQSALHAQVPAVYVDSASMDESVKVADSMGIFT